MSKNVKQERVGQSIKIKKYDDIFDDGAEVVKPAEQATADGGAVLVSPSVLVDFKNHPFKVDGKGIEELMESIREQGVLSPLLVRPAKGADGSYEIISGHRRKLCALKLGLEKVPVIIRGADDDEAVLAMVDSNIQREDILPSEKAFAYKMKLDAIKKQGARSDLSGEDNLTSGQVVRKLESAELIGQEGSESGRQIRRYVRLTELTPGLLNAIDNKKMSFNAGVMLSYLNEDEIKAVDKAAAETRRFPTLSQAKDMREAAVAENGLTGELAIDIMTGRGSLGEEEDAKAISFVRSEIGEFFPKKYTAKQIKAAIIKLLKERG